MKTNLFRNLLLTTLLTFNLSTAFSAETCPYGFGGIAFVCCANGCGEVTGLGCNGSDGNSAGACESLQVSPDFVLENEDGIIQNPLNVLDSKLSYSRR